MVHLGRGKCRKVLVAVITGIACRRQVRGRLGQGVGPVVAGAARTRYHPRVGIGCRFPRYRSMASVAGLSTGWNVLCRASLGIHRGVATVVTAQAVACRSRVTHRRRGKGHVGIVAGVALCGGRNMRTRLRKARTRRLVTGITGTHSRGEVGVSSGCPGGRRRVAGIALTAIVHVIGRFVLSVVDQIRRRITVAGRAIACGNRRVGRRVIHRTRHEGDETVVVARVALRPGRDVGHWLGQGIHRGKTTTVTSRTLSRSPGVIHCCRLEGSEVAVTGVALRRSRDVRTRLGGRLRDGPVMTSRTSPGRTGSMYKIRPGP